LCYLKNEYPPEFNCFCHTCGGKCITNGFVCNPKINAEQRYCHYFLNNLSLKVEPTLTLICKHIDPKCYPPKSSIKVPLLLVQLV